MQANEKTQVLLGVTGSGKTECYFEAVATAHDCSMAAVALAWLLAQPGIAAPLASARTPEQLVDLVELGAVDLTAAEIEALTIASS